MSGHDVMVPVDLQTLMRLFADLEEYVVSLDRILSRIGSGADSGILLNYVVERDVFRRLATTRMVITQILDGVVDEYELEEIAESTFKYSDPL
jgi:hypothetical protein